MMKNNHMLRAVLLLSVCCFAGMLACALRILLNPSMFSAAQYILPFVCCIAFLMIVILTVLYIKEDKERMLLKKQVRKDPLTGLLNAVAARDLVVLRLSEDRNRSAALFIVDIDHFKEVNDVYGHLAGDCVLKDVAKILNGVFGPDGIIGRLGGDEFLIYIGDGGNSGVLKEKCVRLSREIRGIRLPDGRNEITVSIGVVCTGGSCQYEELFMKADRALYDAKKSGRDRYAVAEA